MSEASTSGRPKAGPNRGSFKPGEKRTGRAKGTPNRATREIKLLAQEYGPAAIEKLAELAGLKKDKAGDPIGQAQSEKAQVSALNELLDRGYGRPTQPISGDPDGEPLLMQIMGTLEGSSRGLPGNRG